MKTNISGNVSQLSVQDQAVFANQDSIFPNAADEAEIKNIQVARYNNVVPSVQVKGNRHEHEVARVADQDETAALLQTDDENPQNFKGVK